MPIRFLDTNLLIRYFTRDDKEKAAKVLALLQRVERGEEQITSSPMVIFETVFTLEHTYNLPRRNIQHLIEAVLSLADFKLPLKIIYRQGLQLFVSYPKFSFADAYNAAYMANFGLTEIYSYDSDFDALPETARLEPK